VKKRESMTTYYDRYKSLVIINKLANLLSMEPLGKLYVVLYVSRYLET